MTLTNLVAHSGIIHWAQLFLVTVFWLWTVLFAGIRHSFFHTGRRLYKHHSDCFSCVTSRKSVRTVETGGLRSFPKRTFFETFTHGRVEIAIDNVFCEIQNICFSLPTWFICMWTCISTQWPCPPKEFFPKTLLTCDKTSPHAWFVTTLRLTFAHIFDISHLSHVFLRSSHVF